MKIAKFIAVAGLILASGPAVGPSFNQFGWGNLARPLRAPQHRCDDQSAHFHANGRKAPHKFRHTDFA
jgi:hypothetical protein